MNSVVVSSAFAQASAPSTSQSAPSPAASVPPNDATKKAARQAYGDGQKAFDKGDFAEAEAQFSKANELIPSVNAAYWIAICLNMQGKSSEAYAAFQALLADPAHTSLSEDKLATAQSKLEELSKTPANITITMSPTTAMVSIDGTPQLSTSPLEIKLAPGAHKINVGATGYQPVEREITVKPAEKSTQNFELVKEPEPVPVVAPTPPPEPTPPAQEPKSKLPAYITLGVAGASAVVGTIFGIQALSKKSDYNKNPTSSAADDVERNALIADMAFGVAVTLGITGVVLLTSDDSNEIARDTEPRRAPVQTSLSVTPYVSSKGGGASALLKF
jgi:hypothetical protein